MPTTKPLEDLFRERFENLEETPPAFAWDKIRQDITPTPEMKTKPKSGPGNFTWLKSVALISVISVSLLFMQKYNKAMETQPAATETELQMDQDLPVEIAAETAPETEAVVPEKAPFRAYEPNAAEQLKATKAAADFVKKPYLTKVKKAETMPVATAKKKLNATKVVYVVTVDPKSTSVQKVSTAVTDSAGTNGTAN